MNFRLKKTLTSSRGAALITILGFSVVIMAILQSVLFDSKAEHIAAQHKLSELRARYNARAGIEVNLLRALMYQKAQSMIGDKASSPLVRPYLDFLWHFPLVWPLPSSQIQSDAEKEEIKQLSDDSFLKGGYNSIITPEDGKIDLNDLSSPIPYLQIFTFDTVVELLRDAVTNDKILKEKYQDNDLVEIVNNLADWTDVDNESRNGGSEQTISDKKLPLNRSFVSLEEIKKVPKVTEDIYNILNSHATVYGSKGLNINYASGFILRALGLLDQSVGLILSRTQIGGGSYSPFGTKEIFCQFMREQSVDICDTLKTKYKTDNMLQFNTALHFRIESFGQSQKSSSQAEILIFDAYRLSRHYKKSIETHKKILQEERSDHSQQNKNPHLSKKPDSQKINYNSFQPVFIMYWKENF